MRSSFVSGRMWSQLVFVVIVVGGAIAGWEALSDDQPAKNETPEIPVALVDVARIFKQDRTFNRKMNEIKAEIEEYEVKVKSVQAEIKALEPKEITSDVPSGIAADMRAKAAKLQADLTAEVSAKRQAFLQKESHVYYDRYEALEAATAKIAIDRNVGLVLRFKGDPMVRADRASVLQGVNRAVVYSRALDLTDEVIELLNAEKL